MERLNDIMGRTAQRRQHYSEQRSSPGTARLGSRPPQPQQPVSRRPLPEQRARLGQSAQPQSPLRHPVQDPGEPGMYERRAYNEAAPQSANYEGYVQGQQLRHAVDEDTASYPSYQTRTQPGRSQYPSTPSRPQKDYYVDSYVPGPRADVMEEWDEEGDEDEAGMGYGDWEQDEQELTRYKRPEGGMVAEPRLPYSSAYHEKVSAEDLPVARVTRDLRDLRNFRVPAPSPSAQPAHTTEQQRYQRMTQPLNPQVLSQMGREAAARAQEARPVRQTMAREVLPAPVPHVQPLRQVCPRCKGAGYLRANVPFGHPNFGKPIACSCKEAERKEKRRQQLRDMSNLDAFHNQSFKSFNQRVPGVQEAFQAAVEFAENPYGWLLLIGPNGCGKTHLAAAIANQSLDSGAVVLFEAVPDLLDHLRAAFAPSATEVYDQLFSKMREAELLVLDDLGAQQSSPWANEKLFQLLNYRYNMGMPTVITANPKGLQGIDERIRSRLMDNGLVTSVNLDRARDYRPSQPRRR